jgi:hypothetical protein
MEAKRRKDYAIYVRGCEWNLITRRLILEGPTEELIALLAKNIDVPVWSARVVAETGAPDLRLRTATNCYLLAPGWEKYCHPMPFAEFHRSQREAA